MKIVLAGTLAGQGGVQTHLHWLARALLEAGHQVRMCSLGSPLSAADLELLAEISKVGDFAMVDTANPTHGGLPARCLATLGLVRTMRELAPAVYLACGTGWKLFLPAILSGTCQRRVFHEVMSGVPNGRLDSRWAVKWGFDEVVAQAGPVASNFRRSFHWKPAVKVLPAFPEPLEITARLPEAVVRAVPAGKVRAAFFSRLVPHKGALWLVSQWPKLADQLGELHIFGSGPEAQPIRDLIEREKWGQRVFCHGPYPGAQAYVDLLSSFDLTLLPTLGAEGAPLVLLESMACGVPFVTYDVGGLPDYANPDCTIAPAEVPNSFLDAVTEIVQRLAGGTIDQARLQRFYFANFSYVRLKERWLAFLGA